MTTTRHHNDGLTKRCGCPRRQVGRRCHGSIGRKSLWLSADAIVRVETRAVRPRPDPRSVQTVVAVLASPSPDHRGARPVCPVPAMGPPFAAWAPAVPGVLAPFAVDQAADLCSCGHENVGSAAALVFMSWTVTGMRTTATKNTLRGAGAVKMLLQFIGALTKPACIAGVRVSRPNFNARCGRIKL